MTATSQGTRSTSAARIAANGCEQMTMPPVSNGFVRSPFRSAARTLSPSTTSESRPNLLESSSRHCARSEAGTRMTARAFPSAASWASTSPASTVLPSPTSSARTAPPVGSDASAKAAASIWCGLRSTAEWARAGTSREVPPPPRAVSASAATRWWNPLSRGRTAGARETTCDTQPIPTPPSAAGAPRAPNRRATESARHPTIPKETVPASRSQVHSRGNFGAKGPPLGPRRRGYGDGGDVKFTCERCGKRFASVDEPTAGRVYRIRCRCGNIIHITSPHAEQDAAKRQGGQPSLDRPRITGATPTGAAMPPIPAGQRSGIPAGDATSRVSLTPSPAARIHDPAVPRRTEPAVRTATGAQRPATSRSPTGTHPVARSVTGSHPLATPASALDAYAEPAPRFEPALEPREPTPPRSRSPGAKSSSFAIPAQPAKSIPPRGTAAGQPAFGTTADVPLPSRGAT